MGKEGEVDFHSGKERAESLSFRRGGSRRLNVLLASLEGKGGEEVRSPKFWGWIFLFLRRGRWRHKAGGTLTDEDAVPPPLNAGKEGPSLWRGRGTGPVPGGCRRKRTAS